MRIYINIDASCINKQRPVPQAASRTHLPKEPPLLLLEGISIASAVHRASGEFTGYKVKLEYLSLDGATIGTEVKELLGGSQTSFSTAVTYIGLKGYPGLLGSVRVTTDRTSLAVMGAVRRGRAANERAVCVEEGNYWRLSGAVR